MELKDRIHEARCRSGMSQEELAAGIGVSRQAVSRWETGDSLPEAGRIAQLAETLGVSADWLLSGSGEAVTVSSAADPKRPATAGRHRRIWIAAALLGTAAAALLGLRAAGAIGPQFRDHWRTTVREGVYITDFEGRSYRLDLKAQAITEEDGTVSGISTTSVYPLEDGKMRVTDVRLDPQESSCQAGERLIRNVSGFYCSSSRVLSAADSEYRIRRQRIEKMCRQTSSHACSDLPRIAPSRISS